MRVMFFSGIGALDKGSKLGESISYLFSMCDATALNLCIRQIPCLGKR